jgi:hypothetical protein
MDLVEDKSVPLYNYNTSNTNAIGDQIDEEEFTLYHIYDIVIPSGLQYITNVSNLLIRRTIVDNLTVFTYKIPVFYRLTGTQIPKEADLTQVSISLSNASMPIFYGSDEILNNQTTVSLEIDTLVYTMQYTGDEDTFELSNDIYAGFITINNVSLDTYPGFSYYIAFTYNASFDLDFSALEQSDIDLLDNTTILQSLSFSMIANVSDNSIKQDNLNSICLNSESVNPKTIFFEKNV